MAKQSSKRSTRKPRQPVASDGPNWVLIGGIVGVAAIALVVLLFLTLSGGSETTSTAAVATENAQFAAAEAERQELAATGLRPYCEDNADRCLPEGSDSAPVLVFEFSDYGCPHCRDFNVDNLDGLREEYIDTGDVLWFTVPYGLTQQGGVVTYLPSANATLCADEQDAGLAFHHELFKIQQTSRANSDRGFMQIAESLGLDTDAFESCIDDNRYNANVLANIELATSLGVRSTPSFVINGELLSGNNPVGIRQLIDSNLGG